MADTDTARVVGHSRRQRKMMAMDLAAQAIAWSITFMIIGPIVLPKHSTTEEILLTVGLTVAGWLIGYFNGLYTGHVGRERTNTTLRVLRTLVFTTLLAALVGVAFNRASRELAAGLAILWTLTIFGRAFVNARLRVRRTRGEHHEKILIVGANADATHFIELIELYPELGLEPIGVVGNAAEASINDLEDRFLGSLLRADQVIEEHKAHFVVVMTSAIPTGRLGSLIEQLQNSGAELMLSADLGNLHQRRLESRSIGFAPVLLVDEGAERIAMLRIKRMMDIAVAAVALLATAPFQLVVATVIKLTSRGPVFYRQARLGEHGKDLDVLRFRTMKSSNESPPQLGHKEAVWSDSRMTVIGRLLEVTGFNEIPQLYNVLRGDMSLVGPKPGYLKLDGSTPPLRMKPGLTGLWRAEANLYPASIVRHELDDLYVQNWSLRLDVGVVVASIELVMMRLIRGASWRHAHGDAPQLTEAPLPPPTAGAVAASA